MIEYFAYGSNMNLERMKKRIGWAPSMRPAFLENYQLLFDKLSNDGGKANIRPHAGSVVEGVLYLLKEKDLLEMDRFEGVADGHYSRDSIEVMTESEGLCRVVTYIAQITGLNPAGRTIGLKHPDEKPSLVVSLKVSDLV